MTNNCDKECYECGVFVSVTYLVNFMFFVELKKLPKLNLRGYWSQLLINFTVFLSFKFLVLVFSCHNLASSIRKCVGSIT